MSNAVMFISFTLVKGASVPDFLLTSEKLNSEYMSKQKGFISWKQLVDGETWADLLTWETMEDAQNIMKLSCSNAFTDKFCSFIDQESVNAQLFSVEKSY